MGITVYLSDIEAGQVLDVLLLYREANLTGLLLTPIIHKLRKKGVLHNEELQR